MKIVKAKVWSAKVRNNVMFGEEIQQDEMKLVN